MNLATATPDGRPSSRVVLLKHYDRLGFVFYTNSNSHKGQQITTNPYAALNFYFMNQSRQIRIEGKLSLVSTVEADEYYNSRALGSRIGAWASKQSSQLQSRDELIKRTKEYEQKFGDNPPRPDYWNGYRLTPNLFEFWEEGEFRLHNRVQFTTTNANLTTPDWQIKKLYP